jgi:hypothetical protein
MAAMLKDLCPLRLVVTAPVVSRVLSLSGVDQLVPIHPSLEAARAASPPATALAALASSPAQSGTGSWVLPHPRRASNPSADDRAAIVSRDTVG